MDEKYYIVDLYHLLGIDFSTIMCDAQSLGKIIVSASLNGGTNSERVIGECREITDNFNVNVVKCYMSSRYDGWYEEKIPVLYLPDEYNCNFWNKHSLYLVLASDLNEANLATEEDIKNYDPRSKTWYKNLKEIQEKGIDFDYEKEFYERTFGKKVLSKGK